jgi:enoyl-CoA hydratase / 3-hydroxyacyl-CoA dehydrogenase
MTPPVVKVVWLDNPPVNAVNFAMLQTIERTLAELDEAVCVVVLRGRGDRAFSAGADVTDLADGDPGLAAAIQRTATTIENAPVPVVAAIHGFCLGGGLELALACDLRFATEDARFGFPEIRLGLIPGGGGTQRAQRLIGLGRARSMLMSGDQIPAVKAQVWGLVEFVVETLDEGIEQYAGGLATQSPRALRELRQLLRETRDRPDYELELAAFTRCLHSADGREGVAAFLEKREPRWAGR